MSHKKRTAYTRTSSLDRPVVKPAVGFKTILLKIFSLDSNLKIQNKFMINMKDA